MRSYAKAMTAAGLCFAVVASASMAGSHATKSSNPDVAARHELMGLVGHNIGILGSTAKGEISFNVGLVQAAAGSLNALSSVDPTTLWTEGTEQGAADLSRAKTEIWSDPDGFKQKFQDMADASAALMDVDSLDALRAGMGALGGTCKGCHETYRGPKN